MSDDLDAHEAVRRDVASALRALNHAFVGHDLSDRELAEIGRQVRAISERLDAGAARNRMELMRSAIEAARATGGSPIPAGRAGFEDRAVAGRSNPTSILFATWREGDVIHTETTLEAAFEGAPGRAHGGIVAALFDDFTGSVIGMLHEPAFTGELTVRFVKPVPVRTPLQLRTWLERRDGRKLYIEADARAGDTVVATCKAIYITVDPASFAAAPDPR